MSSRDVQILGFIGQDVCVGVSTCCRRPLRGAWRLDGAS